ncbi:hypothetical protein KSF78_0000389 [Schistosoma japonicum]|nr:hypothetical protein KSF78_0000389 [Schistosoma japonicum]
MAGDNHRNILFYYFISEFHVNHLDLAYPSHHHHHHIAMIASTSLNCLTSKQKEINQLQIDINKSKNDFVNINCSERPDSQDSISVVSQGDEDDYDYDIEKSSEINRRKSIYNDNDDGDKSEEEKEDTKASLAKRQMSQWIDQIIKPSEYLNNSSVHSIKLDYNHKPDSVYSQTLNPEEDILTQWRLRRRMEQAKIEVSKESFNKSNGYVQLTTPFSVVSIMNNKKLQLSCNEYNLPLDMKICIDDKYTKQLEKYIQQKIKNSAYNSSIEYDKSIRFPMTITSSLLLKPLFSSDYISLNMNRLFINEKVNNYNSFMENVLQPHNTYMTLVEESNYALNMNGLVLNKYENYKMFAYDDSMKTENLSYEDNDDYSYLGSLNFETKPLAYNASPSGLSTIDESTKSSSIKVYIKDTSIQCDLLKHSQTDDSQVQTNQSVFNASFNCCKSLNLYNKSNMREIGTMTEKNVTEACLKVRHKSIRLMVRPQSRNVRLQTPHNMVLCNMTVSNPLPFIKLFYEF